MYRCFAVLVLAISLMSTPSLADEETREMVSGVLEARRVAYLVCELVNKSGATLSDVTLSLKRPNASVLGSPEACDPIPHGASCVLEYPIAFPDYDVAAYCHAELPTERYVRGSLRVVDQKGATRAQSDLETDLHAQLAALSARTADLDSKIAALAAVLGSNAPILAVAYTDRNANNSFDTGDDLIAKLTDLDGNGLPSPGDLLVPGSFPTGFPVTSTRGQFRSGALQCGPGSGATDFAVGRHADCFVGETRLRFTRSGFSQAFRESGSSDFTVEIVDQVGGGGTAFETIRTKDESVLQPSEEVIRSSFSNQTNDEFLDVDLNF